MSNARTLTNSIPIYIPTFNNPTYLLNFIKQLEKNDAKNLVVIDNNSTYPPMKECLSIIEQKYKVVRLDQNFGPHYILRNKQFYQSLPELFCLSDPDLEFSTSLPVDFINELKIISEVHKVGKVGLALEILSSEEVVHSDLFLDGQKVGAIEYEQQFWTNNIGKNQTGDDLYRTTLDTTFALYNKTYFDPEDRYTAIRVAGKFTAKHLGSLSNSIVPKSESIYYKSLTRYSYFGGKLDSEGQPCFEISVLEYTKMVEQIQSLEAHIVDLDSKIQDQNISIQTIFKSKRWKLISSLLRIIGRN
jgi:glycosyltransferase involved in cell wall biosynthesis